jgi:hypothetical protein
VPAVLERRVVVVQVGHREQPADAGVDVGFAALSGVSSYAIFCVRPGPLALTPDPFPRVLRPFRTRPCRSMGWIIRNSTEPASIPAVFATTSLNDADRSGSSTPWTVSTSTAATKPYAVQARQPTCGNAIEPSRLTGATIAAFISSSSRENVASGGATPIDVSSCTSQTTALCRSEVGQNSTTSDSWRSLPPNERRLNLGPPIVARSDLSSRKRQKTRRLPILRTAGTAVLVAATVGAGNP